MTDSSPHQLPRGLRVLVVEDRFVVARRVAALLRELGWEPVGPVADLAAGLDFLSREAGRLGAALLDIDLKGRPVYPLAEALLLRQVPVVFATGYSAPALPEPWRGVPRVQKPFDATVLGRTLAVGTIGKGARQCHSSSRYPTLFWQARKTSTTLG